jgi:hypothetical protein
VCVEVGSGAGAGEHARSPFYLALPADVAGEGAWNPTTGRVAGGGGGGGGGGGRGAELRFGRYMAGPSLK